MKKSKCKSNQSDRLRKRAEEYLAKNGKGNRKAIAGDVRKLIHELHVHQIELEMQNEELRRAQAKIEESRTKYAIFTTLPRLDISLSIVMNGS